MRGKKEERAGDLKWLGRREKPEQKEEEKRNTKQPMVVGGLYMRVADLWPDRPSVFFFSYQFLSRRRRRRKRCLTFSSLLPRAPGPCYYFQSTPKYDYDYDYRIFSHLFFLSSPSSCSFSPSLRHHSDALRPVISIPSCFSHGVTRDSTENLLALVRRPSLKIHTGILSYLSVVSSQQVKTKQFWRNPTSGKLIPLEKRNKFLLDKSRIFYYFYEW